MSKGGRRGLVGASPSSDTPKANKTKNMSRLTMENVCTDLILHNDRLSSNRSLLGDLRSVSSMWFVFRTLRLVVAGEMNASAKHCDDTIRMTTLSHILAPVLQFEVLRLMAIVTVAPTYLSIVEGALSSPHLSRFTFVAAPNSLTKSKRNSSPIGCRGCIYPRSTYGCMTSAKNNEYVQYFCYLDSTTILRRIYWFTVSFEILIVTFLYFIYSDMRKEIIAET